MEVEVVSPSGDNWCSLETLTWDNLSLRRLAILPASDEGDVTEPRSEVPGVAFSRAKPTPVDQPELVVASHPALRLLGLDSNATTSRADFADFFSGNRVLPGAQPAAHCYCGHQFGHFSGQLGDGATMYLGEVVSPAGARWEVQFKGAGRTHYSRSADGRKVLRSSLREFLCSEANHALGMPTTRAGSLVTSKTMVIRDVNYDGNASREKASVVLRIAPSFLRFGSFEICKPRDPITGRAGPSVGQHTLLNELLTHVSGLLLPEEAKACAALAADHKEPSGKTEVSAAERDLFSRAFAEIVLRTARLVAHWQTAGFCHGVLNTDNMSVLGLTIDYGPFGYMEAFDPEFACNASDGSGRYAYAQQPSICHWNCERLAEALAPILPRSYTQPSLDAYMPAYKRAYMSAMRAKLGLRVALEAADETLMEECFAVMKATGADFTCTFRALCDFEPADGEAAASQVIGAIVDRCASPSALARALRQRAQASVPQIPIPQLMQLVQVAQQNPAALSMLGDPELVKAELMSEFAKVQRHEELLERAQSVEAISPAELRARNSEAWKSWLTTYAQRLAAETPEALAQQQAELEQAWPGRREAMRSANPRVVLRNWIAQEAIDAAGRHDYAHVEAILEVLTHPYEERHDRYGEPPSASLDSISVS